MSKGFQNHFLFILLVSFLFSCTSTPRKPDLSAKSDEELIAIVQSLDYKPLFSWFKSSERIQLEQTAIEYLGAKGHGRRTPEQEKKILAVFFELLDKNTHAQRIYWTLPSYKHYTPIILPKLKAEWEKYKHSRFRRSDVLKVLVTFSSPEHPEALPLFLNMLIPDEYGYRNSNHTIRYWAIEGISAIGLNKKAKKILTNLLNDSTPEIKVSIAKALLEHTDETELPLKIMIEHTQMSNQKKYHYYINHTLPVFFRMGSRAKQAAPLLKKMVLSEDGYCPHRYFKGYHDPDSKRKCQEMAAVVLWRVEPVQRKFLIRFFEKGIKNIKMTTSAFYSMDKDALPAVPVLIRNYKLSSGKLKIRLAFVLEQVTGKKYPETDIKDAYLIRERLEKQWK